MYSCKITTSILLLSTLTPFFRLKILLFQHEIWAQDHLYVDNMCEKFQVHVMCSKKDIQNLLTWDTSETFLTTTHVGKFGILFFCRSFGLEISHS